MKLVLVRHGESVWNKENLFTGWTDVELSEKGVDDAMAAGRELKKHGFVFDLAFSSWLVRAEHTLQLILLELEQQPHIERSWRLNERHYGALQGLNKAEMMAKFGDEQVKLWRRSYDVRPPALTREDPRWPGHDPRYASLSEAELPLTECLKDTVARVLPYWEKEIAPAIRSGKRVIIAAHGNSIRSIVKHLEGISDADIVELNIPLGTPLVYELDENLKPISKEYLGDQDAIAAGIAKATKGT